MSNSQQQPYQPSYQAPSSSKGGQGMAAGNYGGARYPNMGVGNSMRLGTQFRPGGMQQPQSFQTGLGLQGGGTPQYPGAQNALGYPDNPASRGGGLGPQYGAQPPAQQAFNPLMSGGNNALNGTMPPQVPQPTFPGQAPHLGAGQSTGAMWGWRVNPMTGQWEAPQ